MIVTWCLFFIVTDLSCLFFKTSVFSVLFPVLIIWKEGCSTFPLRACGGFVFSSPNSLRFRLSRSSDFSQVSSILSSGGSLIIISTLCELLLFRFLSSVVLGLSLDFSGVSGNRESYTFNTSI